MPVNVKIIMAFCLAIITNADVFAFSVFSGTKVNQVTAEQTLLEQDSENDKFLYEVDYQDNRICMSRYPKTIVGDVTETISYWRCRKNRILDRIQLGDFENNEISQDHAQAYADEFEQIANYYSDKIIRKSSAL